VSGYDEREPDLAELREKAEAEFNQKLVRPLDVLEGLSSESMRALLHELQVHQIELTMQNEELRRSEVALGVARARYFDLYDLAPVGYCTVNELGVIKEANFTLSTLLGLACSAIVKTSMTEYIFTEDQDIYYLLCQPLMPAAGRVNLVNTRSCELRIVNSTGSWFWAHLAATAEPEPAGDTTLSTVAGAIRIVVTDITERKAADAVRLSLESELALARNLESIGRLAGGVAHDFNNKLTVILGHVGLIMGQLELSDPMREDVEQIREAAVHSGHLTRQLLSFARKEMIRPKVLDLNATVSGMVTMLKRLIGDNIHLLWEPGSDLWPVNVDPSQLDRILVNLIVNARDAIDGVGVVELATYNSTPTAEYCAAHVGMSAGEYVTIVVRDDGSGIDEHTLPLVFNPFFTTKETGEGTGLGLSVVHGVVRQNRGCIDVRSELGVGSTFVVYLPRSVERLKDEPTIGTMSSAPGGRETILVVEDEPIILKLTQRVLSRLGYKVLTAGTSRDALRIANDPAAEIDLLLTDVVMPEMNGWDLSRNFKLSNPSVETLFMSAYAANVIDSDGLLEEDVNFLQKPFSIADLGAAVRAALDSKKT
jgi:PAS domain S-box-containing protein